MPWKSSCPQAGIPEGFCHGETPGPADLCLVAQVTNNGRFKVDMTSYPTIGRIHAACMKMPAFEDAAPANQPDSE